MAVRRVGNAMGQLADTDVYFVWVATQRDPTPQLWYGDQVNGSGQYQKGPVKSLADAQPGDLVAFHKVPPDIVNRLSFDELVERYPPP